MVTAVVASRLFCALSVLLPVLPLALLLVSSALRSSPLSRGLFTTTAYADSLPALTGKVSPGKAPELSPRAVGLYPPRSFDNLWTSPSLAGSSPVAGLSARSCFYGRGFAFRFFQLCLAATPCGLATVAVIGSGDLLSCHKFRPMMGTLAAAGGRGGWSWPVERWAVTDRPHRRDVPTRTSCLFLTRAVPATHPPRRTKGSRFVRNPFDRRFFDFATLRSE